MNLDRDHIIHSRGGKLGDNVTPVADAERIVAQAVAAGSAHGVVFHFHGGLVARAAARGIANRLAGVYEGAGTYPIFFIWESGFLETLRNNLGDILHDKVFHELLKKVGEWVLKEGAGGMVTRGAGQAVNVDQLRRDFDEWLTGGSTVPPIKDSSPGPGGLTTRGVAPDEDDLAARIESEIELDEDFEKTIAGLAVSDGRVPATTTRGAGIEPATVSVVVDQTARDAMFPARGTGTTRGGIPWLSVAKFVAKVVIAVLRRFWNERDHGGYTTVVEEVLRAAYLAKVGEVVWRQMKKDTADAFQDGEFAGTVLLNTLAKLQAKRQTLPRITLVGHSTGAVYINHLIRKIPTSLSALRFDVVFLAPACRCEDFAELLEQCGNSIAHFRMFGMKDGLEQNDQLLSVIYPRSLLYFVSGVVEGDVDAPIVGMQRFIGNERIFSESDFPEVDRVRDYLAEIASRTVWSIATGEPGLASSSTSHGDFDNDVVTVKSVASILSTGF